MAPLLWQPHRCDRTLRWVGYRCDLENKNHGFMGDSGDDEFLGLIPFGNQSWELNILKVRCFGWVFICQVWLQSLMEMCRFDGQPSGYCKLWQAHGIPMTQRKWWELDWGNYPELSKCCWKNTCLQQTSELVVKTNSDLHLLGPTVITPWTWYSEADGTASMNAIRGLGQVCSFSFTPCWPVPISVVCPFALWLDTVVLGLDISLWSKTSLQASSTHCISAAVVLEVDYFSTCVFIALKPHQILLVGTDWASKRTQRLGGKPGLQGSCLSSGLLIKGLLYSSKLFRRIWKY